MAFIKRDVKDRVVQYPRRYQLVEVESGIFDLVPVPGNITEVGTAINKAYLQPIEDALEKLYSDKIDKTDKIFLTLLNGFTSVSGEQSIIVSKTGNLINVCGVIRSPDTGSTIPAGTILFILPVGFIPATKTRAFAHEGNNTRTLYIDTNGSVSSLSALNRNSDFTINFTFTI